MKYLFLFLALAIVATGFVVEQSPNSGENNKANSFGIGIGEIAPDFKLKNVDGRLISLADVKDGFGNPPKGYIVTFTCNTCPLRWSDFAGHGVR